MRTFVGVTDNSWAAFLAAVRATEANFWFPSTKQGFTALRPGEPMLFKTHHPDNRIVGGGFFEHYTVLRASEAWEFMGTGNGVASLDELISRVRRYRRDAADEPDPVIGCVILNDLVFFEEGDKLPAPSTFARSVVRGKTYHDPQPGLRRRGRPDASAHRDAGSRHAAERRAHQLGRCARPTSAGSGRLPGRRPGRLLGSLRNHWSPDPAHPSSRSHPPGDR